jgi:hypothetical protein
MGHTLHSLGISGADVLARGADIDHASQHLLIDAADGLPPTQGQLTATPPSTAEASAALTNHARTPVESRTGALLRQPNGPEKDDPEPEA